jgi:deaminated glutathione amidase
MKIVVLQMTSGIDPQRNADALVNAIEQASAAGAAMLFTPEMSGLLDRDRARASASIRQERDDLVLAAVRSAAKRHAIWVELGSLSIDLEREDGKRANRSFVINDQGEIVARYDKVHLFDADLPTGESWRESSAYASGEVAVAVAVPTPVGLLGLSVCYDVRFPQLYQTLSAAGAKVLSIPAAFTVPTGEAHWHVLMRARAIENACFVVAAAQTGIHEDGRATYGHSLVVSPWGDVLLDMGTEAGLAFCEVDSALVDEVRSRIPVIAHRRPVDVSAA